MFSTVPVTEGPQPAWLDRLIAATFVVTAAGIVWLLLSVTPDAKGYDTHTQLGLSPCSWPGSMGIPCPTCGATTAACHLVHLNPVRAVITQPFGAAVALLGLAAASVAAFCLARRRSFLDVYAQLPIARLVVGMVLLLLLSWLYKYLTFEAV